MGTGVITANLGDGQYTVNIPLKQDGILLKIAESQKMIRKIEDMIAEIEKEKPGSVAEITKKLTLLKSNESAKINEIQTAKEEDIDSLIAELEQIKADILEANKKLDQANRILFLQLKKTSYEQEKTYLESQPASIIKTAWACYLDTELEGEVSIAEIPNSLENINITGTGGGRGKWQNYINLRHPAAVAYNFAVKYWWAKYKPSYRYAKITSIDKENNKCEITLEPVEIKINNSTLDLNQKTEFVDVGISYMTCGALAFIVDPAAAKPKPVNDTVLVAFTNNDIDIPLVIGFKESPRFCCEFCDNFAFDIENNPTIIDKGDSEPIYITGGCPPYKWAVETAGWSFQEAETEAKVNILTAGCGTGVITVSCACGEIGGNVATGIKSSLGEWVSAKGCALEGVADSMEITWVSPLPSYTSVHRALVKESGGIIQTHCYHYTAVYTPDGCGYEIDEGYTLTDSCENKGDYYIGWYPYRTLPSCTKCLGGFYGPTKVTYDGRGWETRETEEPINEVCKCTTTGTRAIDGQGNTITIPITYCFWTEERFFTESTTMSPLTYKTWVPPKEGC